MKGGEAENQVTARLFKLTTANSKTEPCVLHGKTGSGGEAVVHENMFVVPDLFIVTLLKSLGLPRTWFEKNNGALFHK